MKNIFTLQSSSYKQARNEESRRRNMRVRNCQRSQFGFVARQLCGHHRNIYGQIEIWPPLAILARSPRDKFINLATLGGPSALLASRGINLASRGTMLIKRSTPRGRGGAETTSCFSGASMTWQEHDVSKRALPV